jgi:hypothetical protein
VIPHDIFMHTCIHFHHQYRSIMEPLLHKPRTLCWIFLQWKDDQCLGSLPIAASAWTSVSACFLQHQRVEGYFQSFRKLKEQ